MRVPWGALLALAGFLQTTGAATAAEIPGCGDGRGTCTQVAVPLDRSGRVPGTIQLRVQRLGDSQATLPPLFVFAADPGASAIQAYVQTDGPGPRPTGLETWFRDKRRPIVLIDLRGTGGSGALSCQALQRDGIAGDGAAADARECAATLGDRASLYGTAESVADVEAVRVALGVPAIALFGDGFGAGLALAYARSHPERVERMVLQSPRAPGPLDPLHGAGMRAAAGLLNGLCGRGRCTRVARDPVRDLGRLTARLGRGGSAGIRPYDVFRVLASAGTDLFALARSPGEVRNAVAGDLAPLRRTADWLRERRDSSVPVTRVSAAAAAAQLCEDADLPWPAGTAEADRAARARERVASLPAASFGPFGPAAAVETDLLRLCSGWPTAGPRQSSGRPLPDVPTLLLAGTLSLSAPVEAARAVAAQLPRSTVIVGRGFAESPFFEDPAGCVTGAVDDFLEGVEGRDGSEPVTSCGSYLTVTPVRAPPLRLAAVPPVGAPARPGRTAAAVRLTLRDGILALANGRRSLSARIVRVPALRGGRYVSAWRSRPRPAKSVLRLRAATFVPGVRVAGSLSFGAGDDFAGRLRVSGPAAAAGRLTVRDEVMRGKLGGRRVRLPLTDDFLSDFGVANGY